MSTSPTNQPELLKHHPAAEFTASARTKMQELINQLLHDAQQVEDPKAQALFEVSADVLAGLLKAVGDYEQRHQATWPEQPGPVKYST